MKKIIVLILFALFLSAGSVSAADRHAGQSATMATTPRVQESDAKVDVVSLAAKRRAIQSVLAQYNSPMEESVDAFLHACVKYDLDCYLLPAIAGLESGFGRQTWPGSHNPFGWGGGHIMFDSCEDGIDAVARGLAENYIAQGHTSIESIGSKYAASETWAVRVHGFMDRFAASEGSLALHSVVDSL